jgi:hypothetical protein
MIEVLSRDRRLARNQTGKRRVVAIVRVRGGNSLPAVFNTESQAVSFIRARIAKGTVVHAGGITFMSVSKSRRSIIRRRTASTARALTWLKSTAPVSGAPRSTLTDLSLAAYLLRHAGSRSFVTIRS